ncbi:hypothetical protein CSA56_07040 [candidate division KSB3 bacterium]|uniref:histidine kinase n=1 Tax=candidate division KSB3 bacterium TaxID=2044937 RepID=A0A2G6KG77_9BACT|nr:MAG: hypothetical protein CSA56_07040 [candidate division KSB3 bacterium]
MKNTEATQEHTQSTIIPNMPQRPQHLEDFHELSREEALEYIQKLHEVLAEKDQELLRRHSELALLNRVSLVFHSTFDLERILITVLEEVRRLLEVDACSIWLRDMETDELVCEYAIGPYSQTVRGWRLAPGQGIAGAVAQTGESLIVPDAFADERHFKGVDQRTGQSLRSILCVAMKVGQKVIGVLQVLDTPPNRFTEKDRILQELFATAAAFAIENAHLNEKIWSVNETKSLLIHEIHLRGKNNLAAVAELLSFAKNYGVKKEFNSTMIALINQITTLQIINNLLAEYEWNPFPLSELCSRVIHASLKALKPDKKIFVAIPASAVRISPKNANNLALIVNELVTNTVKHAGFQHTRGHISVHITRMDRIIHVEYQDDGSGYPDRVLEFSPNDSGLGLVHKIVREDFRGELTLYNDHGAVAMLRFPSKNQQPFDAAALTGSIPTLSFRERELSR